MLYCDFGPDMHTQPNSSCRAAVEKIGGGRSIVYAHLPGLFIQTIKVR